jgi:hypothetical protein
VIHVRKDKSIVQKITIERSDSIIRVNASRLGWLNSATGADQQSGWWSDGQAMVTKIVNVERLLVDAVTSMGLAINVPILLFYSVLNYVMYNCE